MIGRVRGKSFEWRDTRWLAILPAAVGVQMAHPKSLVIDVAGEKQMEANVSTLAPDGMIAAIGMLQSEFSWSRIGQTPARIVPINVGNRDEHEAMLAFSARHGIRPVVDTVYDLDRIRDAYRHLESGRFFGKIGINLL